MNNSSKTEVPCLTHLTKKLFIRSKTCPRLGWLLRNRPGPAELSLGEQFRIAQGIGIGQKARELFPEGILIEQKGTEDAAKRTQELLADPATRILFEATFLHNRYAARADILIRKDSGWDLIEVKSSTAKKILDRNGKTKDPKKNNDLADLIDDMAYTALIAGKNGLPVANVRLMLVAETFQLGMAPGDLFRTFDFTPEVTARTAEFDGRMEPLAAVLDGPEEPAFRLIGDCKKCEFFKHCIPPVPECTIFDIPRLQEKQLLDLYEKGIVLVKDIPADYPLSGTQVRPVECMRSGMVIVDRSLRGELAKIRWPAHYLDFETTQTAYPLYGNVHPYEMIATQYSIHTCSSCGVVLCHREYLADPARDCRRELAEMLIRDLDGDGSVLSYSRYEEQVIAGLMERYPDLKEPLAAILRRIVDLLDCAKCANHPEFRGSNSIKLVLPALVPEMTYDGLPIANGQDALVTFAWMAQGKFSVEECARKREEMLAYCKQDTLAMVKIHEVFERMAKNR